MNKLGKILAIDIGAGTQDILFYDSDLTTENCISLILPSPTRYFAKIIEHCREDLCIEGDPIGGGTLPSLLKRHLEKGYRIIMDEEAALTVRNNLSEVSAFGIEIVPRITPACKGKRLKFSEVQIDLLKNFLAHYGEGSELSLVAISVQDHGVAPPGISNREFRFRHIAERLQEDNRPEHFVYTSEEIPGYFKRMQAAARSAKSQSNCDVVLMDTSFAAILGCMEESSSALFVNVGNSHTLAALIHEGKIEGLMEHHTSCLTTEKLDDLLVRFKSGSLTSREILEDGGHGAVILGVDGVKNRKIVVTGPNRALMQESKQNVYFAAPHGNMMLTGPFGLVKGAKLSYGGC